MAKTTDRGFIFEPPIVMDLRGNPGPVRFDRLSEFHDWLTTEVEYWEGADKLLPRNEFTMVGNLLDEVRSRRSERMMEGAGNVQAITDDDKINQILENYATGRCLHSQSPIARQVEALISTGQRDKKEQAVYLLAATHGLEIPVPTRNVGDVDFAALIRAMVLTGAAQSDVILTNRDDYEAWLKDARTQNENLAKRAKNTIDAADVQSAKLIDGIKSVKEMRLSLTKLQNTVDAKVDAAVDSAHERADKAIKKSDAQMAEARRNFDKAAAFMEETMRARLEGIADSAQDREDIKASTGFWKDKRDTHQSRTRFWGFTFILAVGAIIIMAYNWGPDLLRGLNPFVETSQGNFNYAAAVLIAVPAVGLYWVLRQLSRLFQTNLAQLSDADERVAMTETFLSLEGEGKLRAKEDRILILQALFRPGPAAGVDVMPPNWFDLLMRRLDKGKSD